MDLSKATVCVVDQGLFAELAAVLAPSFGRTLYCSTWKTAFPRSNASAIGKGLAEFAAPAPNCLIRHDYATLRQKQLDVVD